MRGGIFEAANQIERVVFCLAQPVHWQLNRLLSKYG